MAEQQQQQPIYLYTTPLRSHKKLGVKKGRDIFGHWAICIEGYCFELAGRTEEEKREGHDRFKINCLPEQQWKDGRELGDEVTAKQVGYTVKYFAPNTIKDIGMSRCRTTHTRPLFFLPLCDLHDSSLD